MTSATNSLDELLSEYSNCQQISQREDVFSYGEVADEVYLIVDGLVGLFIKDENGEEREFARLESGHIFGELALIDKGVRSSRAVTHIDTSLIVFSPQEIGKLMKKNSFLDDKLVGSLCKRIQLLQSPINQLPDIAKVLEEREGSLLEDKKVPNFYLSAHGEYQKVAQDGFDHYLYDKEIECPVCSSKIKVKKIRNSRMRLKEVRDDLRPIYKGFNPEWYNIWSCQECLYTASKDRYFELSKKDKEIIRAEFKGNIQEVLGEDYKFSYSERRSLAEVFEAYYLGKQLCKLIKVGADESAYLWLRLSWLYGDVGEEELSFQASSKALKYLSHFYFKSDTGQLSEKKKDKVTLLLSILLYKHGEGKEALPLLDKLIRNPRTKAAHKRLAKDRFIEIMEEERAKRKER